MTPIEARVAGSFGLDVILAAAGRAGGPDPTFRRIDGVWWRGARTPAGPVALALEREADGVRARAWGPGAELELSRVGALLGCDDDPTGFSCEHPALAEGMRGKPELRFGRTGEVVDTLVPTILGQRVTGKEAFRSYRDLVRRYGDPAPGPAVDLWLPPDPERLANEPYYALHPLGVDRGRATTVIEVCRRRGRLDALALRPSAEAAAALATLPRVGPWTIANVLVSSHGDPDAVAVGDAHLPNTVAYVLAGEPRGTDARMLELLAPWAGHRARVVRLVAATGLSAPKWGPRGDAVDLRRL
ncbi:MAG: DNA-3-methyladenine glycosylase 2 family protein [Myxococcota bacterium]